MFKRSKYKNGILPAWADYISQALVIYSVVTFTLEAEPALKGHPFFYYSEVFVTLFFAVEYVLRLYFAQNRWKYAKSFYGVVDLLATAPMIISLGFVDLRFARIIRLLRLLRLLKFVRYAESSGVLKDAILRIKGELMVFAFVIAGIVYVAAVGIYMFEADVQPEAFGSITRSMWWAVVTLTTVGYGDVYPITVGGKMFTVAILMMSLGIVAIPSGLLASALTQVRRERDAAAEAEGDLSRLANHEIDEVS